MKGFDFMLTEIIKVIIFIITTGISLWYLWKMICKCYDAEDDSILKYIYFFACWIGIAALGINFFCLSVHIINLIRYIFIALPL